MSNHDDIERCEELLRLLEYAVHELPAGVLYAANSSTQKQCSEWAADLNEFEHLCARLGKKHQAFVDDCRWHFEHYAHYLGRRRHFENYEQYTRVRGGPLRVRSWRQGNA